MPVRKEEIKKPSSNTNDAKNLKLLFAVYNKLWSYSVQNYEHHRKLILDLEPKPAEDILSVLQRIAEFQKSLSSAAGSSGGLSAADILVLLSKLDWKSLSGTLGPLLETIGKALQSQGKPRTEGQT